MNSSIYICNVCKKALVFANYPPVGNRNTGFTCPDCVKDANWRASELEARLQMCGEDGKIVKDLHTNLLSPTQAAKKYGYTVEKIMQKAQLCLIYVSGEKRKDISYQDWVRRLISR